MGELGKYSAGDYGFGPFRFASEIDLSPLCLPHQGDGLLVQVRLGKAGLEGVPDVHPVSEFVMAGPAQAGLYVPGLARFAVRDGHTVTVELEPGANLDDVRGYLTAWVFGALCHQNGLLPLHASAVERAGVATAFLGESGAGKSTLAAFLGRRGDRVLSDDICLLREAEADEGLEIVPVAEWLKLWRTTLHAMGTSVREQHRTYSDEDKYRVYPASRVASARAASLRHLVFLERSDEAAKLTKLSSAAALGRMMQTVYLGYCLQAMGLEARVFEQCGRVLAGAQAWVLHAPWGFARMDDVLQLLEDEVLGRS